MLTQHFALLFSLLLTHPLTTAPAHAHGGGSGEKLSPADIEEAVRRAESIFVAQKGTWLLDRTTRIVTTLSDDGDEVEIRIYYLWGTEKLYRFFCGHDPLDRLDCDVAFSGPGAL